MTKLKHLLVLAIVALAALPAVATAGHKPKDKDKSNAAKACRAERGDTDASKQAFAMKYGTAKSGYKNAFGRCVSNRVRAAKDCREERDQIGVEAFRAKYGTEKSKHRNAFGKCVSQHAKHHGQGKGHKKHPEKPHPKKGDDSRES